ncbi:DoxX family protein [Mucilaginibacter sp.]|jgi:hypothetical protein|uniref:DoxX family protein n=1 Tax=Mucilaginibacter sp. TaxID=1882438 RepID=UPI003566D8FF
MKKDKIIYWTATGILIAIFVFSLYMMYTPAYPHLGFPNYFRVELTVLKIIGIVVILFPQFPLWVKEWGYAGFTIVLISACVAHFNSGDPIINALEPLIWLAILFVSYTYMHKLKRAKETILSPQ